MNDPSELTDAELGEPLNELLHLTLPVDDHFEERVRGKIERRVLAGDLLELTLKSPLAAALELLRVPFDWFSRPTKP